jgi:hypothetical protein
MIFKHAAITLFIALCIFSSPSYAVTDYSYEQYRSNYLTIHPMPALLSQLIEKREKKATKTKLITNVKQFENALIGTLFVLIIYFWFIRHREPKFNIKEKLPQTTNPGTLTAESIRVLLKKKYDKRTFAAALLSLAHKQAITLTKKASTFYVIEKKELAERPTAPEIALLNQLFLKTNKIELLRTKNSTIKKTLNTHRKTLKKEMQKKYFKSNTNYCFFGIALSLFTLYGGLYQQSKEYIDNPLLLLFNSLPLLGVALCTVVILSLLCHFWKKIKKMRLGKTSPFVAIYYLAILSILFNFVHSWMQPIAEQSSPHIPLLIALITLVNFLSFSYLNCRTTEGVKQIGPSLGYKAYLEKESARELEEKTKHSETSDGFPLEMSFICALDVPNTWCDEFQNTIEH